MTPEPARTALRRMGAAAALGFLLVHVVAPAEAAPRYRFEAVCEDLGQFCFARGCGGDQIAAEDSCRRQCPSAVTLEVRAAACGPQPRRAPIGRPIRAKG